MTREIRPGFSHEETLHDGTAQSVVNEVLFATNRLHNITLVFLK